MRAQVVGRARVIVLVEAGGSQAGFADAERLVRWLTESGLPAQPVAPAPAVPTQAVPSQGCLLDTTDAADELRRGITRGRLSRTTKTNEIHIDKDRNDEHATDYAGQRQR